MPKLSAMALYYFLLMLTLALIVSLEVIIGFVSTNFRIMSTAPITIGCDHTTHVCSFACCDGCQILY